MHRYLEASLPVFRELGDDANLSGYLGVLALTAIAEGDADEARALAEEALEVARRTRDPMKRGVRPVNSRRPCSRIQGELDESQRVLEESIRRARELGNLRSVGAWTKALGGITFLQGNYPRARELFEQSLAILRSLDDAWGTQGSLSGLALVALEEHDNDSVRRLLTRTSRSCGRAATTIERRTSSRSPPGSPPPRIAIAVPLACTERRASFADRRAPG